MIRPFAGLLLLTYLAALASTAALVDSSAVRAAGDITALSVDGQVGDVVTEGRNFVIKSADADWITGATDDYPNAVYVVFVASSMAGPAGTGEWTIKLTAPPGQALATGVYNGAVWPPERSAGQPGIELGSAGADGTWCETTTPPGPVAPPRGNFTIHELDMAQWDLRTLSATFEHWCEGSSSHVFGEVRFNASDGYKAASARPWRVDFGSLDTGTASSPLEIVISASGTRSVSLGAAAIVGDDASSFTLESNDCSGKVLQAGESCALAVSAQPQTNRSLNARLQVADDTTRGSRVVPLEVTGLGSVDATVVVSPYKFFPVVDKHKDKLFITGTRTEVASADIVISSVASGKVIRTGAIPMGSGDYEWTWNGRTTSGTLAKAGMYAVKVTLEDTLGNTRTVNQSVVLSRNWVEWKTESMVRQGRQISLWGWTKRAKISFGASRYGGGIQLDSRDGFAVVTYKFPTENAKFYLFGWMRFSVEGRSANGHKAMIAMWNPKLGGLRAIDNYDAERKIGPGFKWWTTGAPGEGRSQDRKVAAAVMVWKDLGTSGRSIFDIKRVRLVYEVGTMHKVDPASVAAMSVKRTSDRKSPASVRPSAADATDLSVPRLRDAPEFLPVEEPSPEPVVEAPAPEPSPEPVVEAPAPEPSPEPVVEASGSLTPEEGDPDTR